MASTDAPRASTEDESAPLLNDEDQSHHPIFRSSRSLTALEKILAGVAILLLLIASTFIGLFAGTNHQLSKERHRQPVIVTTTVGGPPATKTINPTGQKPFPAPTIIPTPGPGKGEKKVCLTKDCVLLAGEILNSLDESVDPCVDFYGFATGGFQKSNVIPADRSTYGNFDVTQDNNRKVIQAVLEGEDEDAASNTSDEEDTAEKANLRKLRRGWKACLNEDHLDKNGLAPLLALVHEVTSILGPFAVIRPLVAEEEATEWDGAYTETYEIPAHLRVSENYLYGGKEKLALKIARRVQTTENSHVAATMQDDVELNEEELKVLESRKERMTEVLAFAHSRSVESLFGFALEGDSSGEDSQIQSLFFYQTSGGLPAKQYYEEAPIVDLYTRIITDILKSLGQSSEQVTGISWPKWPGSGDKKDDEGAEDSFKVLAKKVVTFERELMRAGADPELLSNPVYANNPYDFKNLSSAMPFMTLNNYLSAFGTRNHPDKIIVSYPPYLNSLNKVLSRTPDHIVSAYFVTRFSLSYASLLGPSTDVWKAARTLQEVLGGLKKGTPQDRTQFCLKLVDELDGLGLLGGKEFMDRKFGGDSKATAEKVIYGVIDAFKARMHHLSWMDTESADAAIKKAETLLVKIGGPTSPNVTSAVSLQRFFAPLLVDDDLFQNELRARILSETRQWQTLGRARDRGTWLMVPQLVNAYYNPPDGEIVFPAGFLQRPWFAADWPDHLNFGAFGTVAAHELTHAFDNTGAQYDERGLLRDWWTESTVKAFQEKAQCVANTYSKYSITGPDGKQVYINGNLTNGEDLGDSGITFAFSAWRDHYKSKEEDATSLPGLDFTEEQLFFIASARLWAQLIKPEAALVRLRTDPHSPNRWRSNGQLRGFDEFAKAFKCKAGTPMNPTERCNVWKAA